jgi:hypothetical protein
MREKRIYRPLRKAASLELLAISGWRSLEQIECREEVGFALTDQEIAEGTWRDAYERRQERLDNLAPDLAVMLGLAVLPPLMLLLPGLGIAWLKRGFAQTQHRQVDA